MSGWSSIADAIGDLTDALIGIIADMFEIVLISTGMIAYYTASCVARASYCATRIAASSGLTSFRAVARAIGLFVGPILMLASVTRHVWIANNLDSIAAGIGHAESLFLLAAILYLLSSEDLDQ